MIGLILQLALDRSESKSGGLLVFNKVLNAVYLRSLEISETVVAVVDGHHDHCFICGK